MPTPHTNFHKIRWKLSVEETIRFWW